MSTPARESVAVRLFATSTRWHPAPHCASRSAPSGSAWSASAEDFYAIGDRCSHADVSLSQGEVMAEDRQIECYLHGAGLRPPTGTLQCLPATRPVPFYDIHIDGDDVIVVIS